MFALNPHIKSWKKKYFIPITWTGFLFLILDFFIIRYYISTDFSETFSYSYAPFLELVIWIIIVVMNAIFILNFIFFLVSVIVLQWRLSDKTTQYFLFENRNNKNHLTTEFPAFTRPVLGSIYAEIEFDHEDTPNQIIHTDKRQSIQTIALDNIQEYKINHLNVFISDMFHFFKWRRKWDYDQSIIQYPVTIDEFSFKTTVDKYKKSDDSHSEKKVFSPGEWLNFKNFESGDDVKRILWKLYAKNRTLMVRHRENISFDNSESHIYCAFDIRNPSTFWGNDFSRRYALDLYKNMLWNAMNVIKKMDNRIILHLPAFENINSFEIFKEKLVLQNWVMNRDEHWQMTSKGATLFIPDTMDEQVVEHIIEHHKEQISTIVLVETTHHINEKTVLRWLKKIFIKNTIRFDDNSAIFHTHNIMKNKEKILQMIDKNSHIDVEVLTLSDNVFV